MRSRCIAYPSSFWPLVAAVTVACLAATNTPTARAQSDVGTAASAASGKAAAPAAPPVAAPAAAVAASQAVAEAAAAAADAASAAARTPLTSSTTIASSNVPIVEARDAYRRRDTVKLTQLRAATTSQSHPLASWVDYWELGSRLSSAQASEVESFYTRWRGRYVEDRLRNDWLIELGRRRDWGAFAKDFPRFRMNDDREVTCFALVSQHLANKVVKADALNAWIEQRDADDGCHLLAATLMHAQVFSADDVWRKVRAATEASRLRAARQALTLLSPTFGDTLNDIQQSPLRYLNTKASDTTRQAQEFAAITLARIAATDPELAAAALRARWQASLSPSLVAWTWAQIGKQAAQKTMPNALEHYVVAAKVLDTSTKRKPVEGLSDDALAWGVRAALRSGDSARWTHVIRFVEAMHPNPAPDPAWAYWLARAKSTTAAPGAAGETTRQAARNDLRTLAGEMHFYGALAAEDLGQTLAMPPKPAPLTTTESAGAKQHVGLQSALSMLSLGLRDEGVREWNYSLRGMDDRQLLAAAQWACEVEIWDRCINTSDRTRSAVDMAQRYPMPFRRELVAKAREIGVDPAYVYGLIRQESRFIMDARSSAGASGLMQLMPATARWTAGKLGVPYKQEMITDPNLNLTLGTQYLKLVLDDFGGSQAMAAAAYNAGPSRPRRWREGPVVDAAAWAESIPFHETRDYVKKVLINAVYYTAMLGGESTLRGRLGATIGPRETAAATPNKDLP